MNAIIDPVVTAAIYTVSVLVALYVFARIMRVATTKQDIKDFNAFALMFSVASLTFVCGIAFAGAMAEQKKAAAIQELKNERFAICKTMSDDVNAYGTLTEFFDKRTQCELEFGKLALVKSGKSIVWTS